jgi:hypothetical protein
MFGLQELSSLVFELFIVQRQGRNLFQLNNKTQLPVMCCVQSVIIVQAYLNMTFPQDPLI